MGGLKLEIADNIRMFQPRTLKDAIGLACVREEQVGRQNRLNRARRVQLILSLPDQASYTLVPATAAAAPKRLS